MSNVFTGKILHVNLSNQESWVEELGEPEYRKYLGGSALSAYYMLRECKPGTDPYGPDNPLVFMTSVINGFPLSGANRYNVATKSPLTGGYGEGQAGGYWGPMLRRAGFDGIVIIGCSEKPVYMFLNNGEIEVKDASHLWGQLSGEVQEALETEIGDKRICVLQTGVAGENRVRFAALTNQLRHFHGRSGLGAVMGSKNLKAIVVRGNKHMEYADAEAGKGVLQWYREKYDPADDLKHLYGTSRIVPWLNEEGVLPTYNFRDGYFEPARDISGQIMADTILVRRNTCFACAVACKRMVEVAERGVLPKYGGMEYETIAANGSLCGVSDFKAIAEASQWINRYVLDSISTGATIAFVMECFENGILTKNDADGIDLTWGNADALIQMIHKIARREGIGDLLADGVKVAAARLGRGAEGLALHVKGQEIPMHDPRGKVGLGIAYAVSPTGADHMQAPHDPYYETWSMPDHEFTCLGLLDPVNRMDISPKKVRAFLYMQAVFWLFNSIGMCDLVGVPIGILNLEKLQDFINAVTGWNMSIFEMMKVGERANTMTRIFNIREGFTAAEDNLPNRMFEPIRNGALVGKALNRDEMAKALELYYAMCGWDSQGIPTPAKLAELDLSWTLDE